MGQATGCLGDDGNMWTVSFRDDESIHLKPNRGASLKTVAVTGANGFIGGHIVKLLLEKGYKVRGTHLYGTATEFLNDLPKAAKNLTLHTRELEHGCFDDVFRGCDCVFHLASPTLKDQREMKEPAREMIQQAHKGTLNVLESCRKNGVKTVVVTSSMCAAIPKTNLKMPDSINESHWADHEYLRSKGSYYAAAKTLSEKAAVDFLGKMSKDSAFRLIRICPTFTVGPILQKKKIVLNSSMERFARICAGEHHTTGIPNRSISFVDVRDVAAHHIAAYEKGYPGRFFSLTEGWPWTLVYDALKILNPEMKCPKPLPRGTKYLPVRTYNTSRMKKLGVNERSTLTVLTEAYKEIKRKNITIDSSARLACHHDSELPSDVMLSFRIYAGYYKNANGGFFMIETIADFETNREVGYLVFISWIFPGMKAPKVLQASGNGVSFADGKLEVGAFNISLTFKPSAYGDGSTYIVSGEIDSKELEAISFIPPVPYDIFEGTYMRDDGSKQVTLTFGKANNSIIDENGNLLTTFLYNPIKRLFENQYPDGSTTKVFLNASADRGLKLTFVQYNEIEAPNEGSTEIFYLSPNLAPQPIGPSTGAEALANFAGFYSLNENGSFVSIVGTTGTSEVQVKVGICVDGNSKEYTCFNFDSDNNTLKFPQDPNLSITFKKNFDRFAITMITVQQSTVQYTGRSFFAPAPLTAFASYLLEGTDPLRAAQYSLEITVDGEGQSIVYKKDGTNVFDPKTNSVYNAVEQELVVPDPKKEGGTIHFNLTYNADKGISCGVTTADQKGPSGFQSVVYAFNN